MRVALPACPPPIPTTAHVQSQPKEDMILAAAALEVSRSEGRIPDFHCTCDLNPAKLRKRTHHWYRAAKLRVTCRKGWVQSSTAPSMNVCAIAA